jgi:hypothetical protein
MKHKHANKNRTLKFQRHLYGGNTCCNNIIRTQHENSSENGENTHSTLFLQCERCERLFNFTIIRSSTADRAVRSSGGNEIHLLVHTYLLMELC